VRGQCRRSSAFAGQGRSDKRKGATVARHRSPLSNTAQHLCVKDMPTSVGGVRPQSLVSGPTIWLFKGPNLEASTLCRGDRGSRPRRTRPVIQSRPLEAAITLDDGCRASQRGCTKRGPKLPGPSTYYILSLGRSFTSHTRSQEGAIRWIRRT
jgi:hypothetical protein